MYSARTRPILRPFDNTRPLKCFMSVFTDDLSPSGSAQIASSIMVKNSGISLIGGLAMSGELGK